MIGSSTVLAVIPARGGSKGVPRKNLHPLHGKPLLAWTIEAARACPEIDRLILSSEDDEIIAAARSHGCETPFPRPRELASDSALSSAVALHLLANLPERYDYLVWLQPTSPLRQPRDISAALRLCDERGVSSVVTVTEAGKSPYWMVHLDPSGAMRPVVPEERAPGNRQDLPPSYVLNGAVYVVRTDWMRQSGRFVDGHTLAHVMPQERSVDIDSEQDLFLAAWLLSRGSGPD